MMQITGYAMCLAALVTAAALPAHGQGDDEPFGLDGRDVNFSFGDSCDKIEDLSLGSIKLLTTAAGDYDREHFCTVQEPFDCEVLSEATDAFGRLVEAKTEGFCRFVPRPANHQVLPALRRNVGFDERGGLTATAVATATTNVRVFL